MLNTMANIVQTIYQVMYIVVGNKFILLWRKIAVRIAQDQQKSELLRKKSDDKYKRIEKNHSNKKECNKRYTNSNNEKYICNNNLPMTERRNAWLIFGSIDTWHSYVPESRGCGDDIFNVHSSDPSWCNAWNLWSFV